MDICTMVPPAYREVESGHFCACHLYNSPEENAQCEKELEKLKELERISKLAKGYMKVNIGKKKKSEDNADEQNKESNGEEKA